MRCSGHSLARFIKPSRLEKLSYNPSSPKNGGIRQYMYSSGVMTFKQSPILLLVRTTASRLRNLLPQPGALCLELCVTLQNPALDKWSHDQFIDILLSTPISATKKRATREIVRYAKNAGSAKFTPAPHDMGKRKLPLGSDEQLNIPSHTYLGIEVPLTLCLLLLPVSFIPSDLLDCRFRPPPSSPSL